MKSLLKSLEVIEAVAEMQPIGVSDLARRLEMPKSTVQRILQAYSGAGWLQPTGSDTMRWQIGPRVANIQVPHLRGGRISLHARKAMQDLCDQVNETVHLCIPDDHGSMLLIERVDCDQNVRTFSPIGDRSPLHATSTGLSVMAHLPQEDVDRIVRRGLPRYTEKTITDPDALRDELSKTRLRGYSLNICFYRPAVCAIGSAILDARGQAVAGMCISMPASRYIDSNEKAWGELVREAAFKIGNSR